MEKKHIILVFWDHIYAGITCLNNTLNGLKEQNIEPTTIVYLICQYIYENTSIKDKPSEKWAKGRNPQERITFLTEY